MRAERECTVSFKAVVLFCVNRHFPLCLFFSYYTQIPWHGLFLSFLVPFSLITHTGFFHRSDTQHTRLCFTLSAMTRIRRYPQRRWCAGWACFCISCFWLLNYPKAGTPTGEISLFVLIIGWQEAKMRPCSHVNQALMLTRGVTPLIIIITFNVVCQGGGYNGRTYAVLMHDKPRAHHWSNDATMQSIHSSPSTRPSKVQVRHRPTSGGPNHACCEGECRPGR